MFTINMECYKGYRREYIEKIEIRHCHIIGHVNVRWLRKTN